MSAAIYRTGDLTLLLSLAAGRPIDLVLGEHRPMADIANSRIYLPDPAKILAEAPWAGELVRQLMVGAAFHEVGHVLHTPVAFCDAIRGCVDDVPDGPLLHIAGGVEAYGVRYGELCGVLEEVRVENLVSLEFPHVRRAFGETAAALDTLEGKDPRSLFGDPHDPFTVLFDLLLRVSRGMWLPRLPARVADLVSATAEGFTRALAVRTLEDLVACADTLYDDVSRVARGTRPPGARAEIPWIPPAPRDELPANMPP